MKRILIIAVVVIGLLVSLYGVSYDAAYDGVASAINNIAVSLNKVGAVLLPNEFSAPYIDNDVLRYVLPNGETIEDYLELKGVNIEIDILYDRVYRIEHDTFYGRNVLYTDELLRVTRTENGNTFDIYISPKGNIYYHGEPYEYVMVDGLYLEFYSNKNSLDTYNADAIAFGKPTIIETTFTTKETIIGWID